MIGLGRGAAAPGEPLLEIEALGKEYPVYSGFLRRKTGSVKALDGVSLAVRRGETVGIVGESGCGKTTLGKCLLLLQRPSAGRISYAFPDGRRELSAMGRSELMAYRKRAQMVFQDPFSSLNPSKKIFEAFDEPLRLHGRGDPGERKAIIAERLSMVNLKPEFMWRYPHEFSGGQRQRICIARALCIDPEMVVCDEPVSALDVSIQAQVLNLMKDLQASLGLTYLFIAHDLGVVQYMSDRIMVMYLGRAVETAVSADLYGAPRHPYTEALLSAVPVPSLEPRPPRIILEGDVPSPIDRPAGCPFRARCRRRMPICAEVEPRLSPCADDPSHQVACHLHKTVAPPEMAAAPMIDTVTQPRSNA